MTGNTTGSMIRRPRLAVSIAVGATVIATACAPHAPAAAPRRPPPRLGERVDPFVASARVYERMGLIAATGAFPFVGRITFVAGPTPDSTIMLVALSFSRRALTVTASEAFFDVALDITRDGRIVRHVDTTTTVRVDPTLDTILFQDALALAPGDYRFSLVIHDAPSVRTASRAGELAVPRLGGKDVNAGSPHGTMSSAIAARDAAARTALDSGPRLVQWPSGTVVVGRDSIVPVYVERYGTEVRCALRLQARSIDGSILWHDAITLVRAGVLCAGLTPIPVSRLGPGETTLEVINDADGDTSTVPLFVTLGPGVPVSPYAQQLDYLRYFTTPATLATLRDAPPSQRGATWTAFVQRVGLDSLTSYLQLLHQTDARFPDEGVPGWQTARGRTYITLGEPEQIFLQGASHRQIWNYQRYLTSLVFVDDSGTGHWRLTPRSETDYQLLLRRVRR
jgi:GWxTD domain-containing protein